MTVDSRVLPQPPSCNACQLSHNQGLASSAFARHYSRNHYCFLFLWVLRCFTSPRSLQLPYTFRQRSPDMTPVFQGFPIRTSSDQSLFTNSPRLIAGYNVLHRLLVPRHPPIALSSLSIIYKDARVHCEILKKRASPPPTPATNRRPGRQMVRKKAPPTGNRPFRTQQRANKPPQHFPLPHHTRRRLYSRGTTLSQCSTNQNPPAGNTRPGTEVNKQTNHTGQPAKSSLERR